MPPWPTTPQHLLHQNPLPIERRHRRRRTLTTARDLDQLLFMTTIRNIVTHCRRLLHHSQHQVLTSLVHLLADKVSVVLRNQVCNAPARRGLSLGHHKVHHRLLHLPLPHHQASLTDKRLHPLSSGHSRCLPSSTQTTLDHPAFHQLLSPRLPMGPYLHLASLRSPINPWPPRRRVATVNSSMAAPVDKYQGPIPMP
jgi:hypothetical protein